MIFAAVPLVQTHAYHISYGLPLGFNESEIGGVLEVYAGCVLGKFGFEIVKIQFSCFRTMFHYFDVDDGMAVILDDHQPLGRNDV